MIVLDVPAQNEAAGHAPRVVSRSMIDLRRKLAQTKKLEDYAGSVYAEATRIDLLSHLAVQADILDSYQVLTTIRSRRFRPALRNRIRLPQPGHLSASRGTHCEVTRMP